MAPYPATTIANEFLHRSFDKDEWLTHMKLQKLVYLAHGWHLGFIGTPLVQERVRAWKWGPVILELYREFARFGGRPIDELYSELSTLDDEPVTQSPRLSEADAPSREIIEAVWDNYKSYSATELSSLTHKPNTPWDIASRQNKLVISQDIIRDHFRKLASA